MKRRVLAYLGIAWFIVGYTHDVYAVSEPLRTPRKKWTIIIEMAADNDLKNFATRNIKQMLFWGSNDLVNIVVELHIRVTGNKKITRRYYIEKGRIVHINTDDPTTQKMDSGDPNTLISCCEWAITNYPAEQYILILWNHGTGIIDPIHGPYGPSRIVHATELFTFNPTLNILELDRSIGFLDFINSIEDNQRGICWDDSSGNYLTNQKLAGALDYICTNHLRGKKFSIIGFDACLMSMVEIADLLKPYTDFMVGSQEVELGTGWNYQLVLAPFHEGEPGARAFAQHIVEAYEKTYNKITSDYTLSAIDVASIDLLSRNIHAIAHLILECMKVQQHNSVKRALQASRRQCTHFDEPSYIDLHHFYSNLHTELSTFQLNSSPQQSTSYKKELAVLLQEGLALIDRLVIANTAGSNLAKARGLSMYFPEHKMHVSYPRTPFAHHNNWFSLLNHYLAP